MTKWINTIFKAQLSHWPKGGITLSSNFDAYINKDPEYIEL